MSYIAQPLNSMVRISPYSQRLLQTGIQDSRVYLSKATNALLCPYVFGYTSDNKPSNSEFPNTKLVYSDRTAAILDGLNTAAEMNGNTLSVTLNPGQLICDTTILIFPTITTLDIDTTLLTVPNNEVWVSLSVNYQWLDTLYEQPPRVRLMLINPEDPYHFGPDDWETRLDRLVITVFKIDLSTKTITNIAPNPCQYFDKQWLNIKGHPYEIAPNISFLNNFQSYTEDRYVRKEVIYSTPCLDPIGMDENHTELPLTFFPKDDANSIGVQFTIKYDPNLLTNPKFIKSTKLEELKKTLSFDIDYLDGVETGQIKVVIGDTSIDKVTLPQMVLGTLGFDFLNAAILDSSISLLFDEIVVTYDNLVTELIPIFPRTSPTIETNTVVPTTSYAFQPAFIDFGKITLTPALNLVFNLNGVQERYDFDTQNVSTLKDGNVILLGTDMKIYLTSDSQLFLESITALNTFSSASITSDDNTKHTFNFELETGNAYKSWAISNDYFYWTPTASDVINFEFNEITAQQHVLTEADLDHIIAHADSWVNLPSMVVPYIDCMYYVEDSIKKVRFKVSNAYVGQYSFKTITMNIINGSGVTSYGPKISNYRRNQSLLDISHINLSVNDKITYSLNGIDTNTFVFTRDILTVLSSQLYSFSYVYNNEIKIIKITSSTLVIEPYAYNGTVRNIVLTNSFVDNGEPSTTPCLWAMTNIISTRPITANFVENPNKRYSTNWKIGNISIPTTSDRDFYITLDVSDLNKSDYTIQCFENNFMVQPLAIEQVDSKNIRIWMPESFVMQENIPQLKIVIMG